MTVHAVYLVAEHGQGAVVQLQDWDDDQEDLTLPVAGLSAESVIKIEKKNITAPRPDGL